ncbi:MAG: ABC transporter permease [Acidimicrobiia bacterium]|jgi:ABC-2 type transport system permease protein
MGASLTLTRQETRLFLREPMALIFGLLFPPLLLLAMGYLFPGFDEPLPELGGERLIAVYAPTVIGFALAVLSLMTLPMTLAGYREMGILRRLRTTPVHPSRLLLAQVSANTLVAVVGSAATVLIAWLAFDVPFPASLGWLVFSFLLGLTSMFTLGLLIGALARTPTVGQVLGFSLFFPMLFFAGVYVPRPFMSEGLNTVSNFTPLGAAVQAMTDSWAGVTPSAAHLVVMAVWTLGCGLLAIRFFRWE